MTEPALHDLAFRPLALGAVRPRGWLLTQLRIQADGLSGHLDEFWPDVGESGWIGGCAEGWERGPYWLDGVVPLAFLLDDETLLAKVRRWVDYILAHQREDGWLGPVQDQATGKYRAYDPWPTYVTLKALTQYGDATGDPRVVPAVTRFLHRLSSLLNEQPLFDWGWVRWADLALTIHWLFDRTGESWLLDLASRVRSQGFDWGAHFADFPHTQRTAPDGCTLITHVVNNAMAIKQPGVWYRQSGDTRDRAAAHTITEALDTYHGQVTGVFTGDEHLAGKNPSQGTELCAVVEMMFSLETLISHLGDLQLADRLERIAFNALPATFKPDMWAHQYDQQANQVLCRVADDRIYTSNGPDANLFGLEPNYGCCTANMHQGWPKFASHLWMATPDGGLVAASYAPSEVATRIRDANVRVTLDTEYPFSEDLSFSIRTDREVAFPLRFRIPVWTEGATISVDGSARIPVQAGTVHTLTSLWGRGDANVIELHLPMPVTVESRFHGSAAVVRGPLVFSLKVGEDWRLVGGELPHGDWEVYPTSAWNYALRVDRSDPARSVRFERRPMGDAPFSPDGAPIVAHVQGCRVAGWTLEHNAAGVPPWSPVDCSGPLENLELIPYGCTSLRVTEFPTIG